MGQEHSDWRIRLFFPGLLPDLSVYTNLPAHQPIELGPAEAGTQNTSSPTADEQSLELVSTNIQELLAHSSPVQGAQFADQYRKRFGYSL